MDRFNLTPEMKAACRIVLGDYKPETVRIAMQGVSGSWTRTLNVHQAILALKALKKPTPPAIDAVFDGCLPDGDHEQRCMIAIETANIERAEADAMRAEAAELRAYNVRRRPAND